MRGARARCDGEKVRQYTGMTLSSIQLGGRSQKSDCSKHGLLLRDFMLRSICRRGIAAVGSCKRNFSGMSKIEEAKKAAAYKAVDENLPKGAKSVGLGSGSTVVYVAQRLGELNKSANGGRLSFKVVPTGHQSLDLLLDNDLLLGNLEREVELDVAFDGADEVDRDMNLIKGGGGCLLQEKLIASASKRFVVVADHRKRSKTQLGTSWTKGIPVEVVPNAYSKVTQELYKIGAKNVVLRSGMPGKAGPVITDNSNCILDADFGEISNASKLDLLIKMIVGVIETGIFSNIADKVYFGEDNGEVTTIEK